MYLMCRRRRARCQAPRPSCWALAAALLPALLLAPRGCAGQGYPSEPTAAVMLGATRGAELLATQYAKSKAWRNAWRLSPSKACSTAGGGSLCGATGAEALQLNAQLVLATSPSAYSSTDVPKGAARLLPEPFDQKPCQACTAFAVAVAATAAMAAVLGVDAAEVSVSPQALLCSSDRRSVRGCNEGETLPPVLEQVVRRGPTLPTAACLPYRPDASDELPASRRCTAACGPSPQARLGRFTSKRLASSYEVQRHIRRFGAAVSRFDGMTTLSNSSTAPQRPSTVLVQTPRWFLFGHAVALVGYDNEQGSWLVQNSWGTKWGDGGYFRIANGTCAVSAEAGEVYGLEWRPFVHPKAMQLPVRPMSRRPGCFEYTARPGDYASRVAWLAGIPLQQFMLDNRRTIKDLDTPLEGTRLALCNASRGTIATDSYPVDTQLEALLAIKSYLDPPGDVLTGWTAEDGAAVQAAYCTGWAGVRCGPPAEDGQQNVTEIVLTGSTNVRGLSGVLPPALAFAGLPGLFKLAISDHKNLTYTLPEDWGGGGGNSSNGNGSIGGATGSPAMPQLLELELHNNSISGTLPASWSSMAQLQVLILGSNRLEGSLPPSWGKLARLQRLELQANMLTGPIPAPQWGDMSRLAGLYIWGNRLSGPILPGALPLGLQNLQAGKNAFSGPLPVELRALKRLEVLFLNDNRLTGTLPEEFAEIEPLRRLWLLNTPVAGTLPPSWSALSRLESLDLTSMKLRGPIPTSWASMSSMVELLLGGNSLNSTLPAALSAMTKLQTFCAEENQLTGILPASLGELKSLQVLKLSSNRLTGEVPPSVWGLRSLKELYLSRNNISGCPPSTFLANLSPLLSTEENVFAGTRLNASCATQPSGGGGAGGNASTQGTVAAAPGGRRL